MNDEHCNMAGHHDLDQAHRPRHGAVVLCGGESRRMGCDKASLQFADETLLAHTVRIVGQVAPLHNMVVVAAQGQRVPPLPEGVALIHDEQQGRGPLPAVAAGLRFLARRVDVAFVTACDVPLLKAALVERLFQAAVQEPAVDAVVPQDDERVYPLTAAYRTECARSLQNAIAAGYRSLQRALNSGEIRVRAVSTASLQDVDPTLESLINCNTQQELEAALEIVRRRSRNS